MPDQQNTESTQTELLARIKARRTPSEPEGQPKEGEVVDVSVETPAEEAEVIEAEVTEPEEEAAPVEASDEEEESLYLELDGEEISLDDIRKWKKGHMQEADYTRKTQTLADDRRNVEALGTKQQALIEDLQSHIDLLADMTDAEFKGVDWDELRDLDTSEYLKLKEKQAGKQGKLDAAKAKRNDLAEKQLKELASAEMTKLLEVLPHWSDPAKQEADKAMLQKYLIDKKWNDADFKDIVNHKHLLSLLDAATFHARKTSEPATTKKVRKAPVIIKGKRATVTILSKQVEEARAKFKRSGKIEDAMAFKKLKRQLN